MRLFKFSILLLGVLAFLSKEVLASWRIEARKLTVYQQSRVIVAEGQVVISGRDLTIFAQRARYHMVSKRLYLWGPVKILTPHGDWIKGKWASLNLRSGEGEIQGAHLFIKKDRVQVKAERMRQIGERKYVAYQAVITTCDLECKESPPWSFHARKVEISEGRARGKMVSFWIKRLPVAFSPLVTLALKRERKSGVLFPRLVQGDRTGFGLEVPLFLALHDSFDLTLYPLYTGKRGLLLGIEGRYRLSGYNQGIIRYRYLRDRLEDDDYNRDGIVRKNRTRYWLTAKLDHQISSRTDLHLDLDLLSDRDFLQEFSGGDLGFLKSHRSYLDWFGRGLEEKNKTYRTSRFWLAHRRENTYFEMGSTYHDAVLPERQARLLSPLGRVLGLFMTRPLIGPFTFSLEGDATYWYREEGSRGLRTNLSPELILNFPLGPTENALSYRLLYTSWRVDWDNGTKETLNRTLYEISAQSSLEFYRVYNLRRFGLSGIRHSLRPYVFYFYRPPENQEEFPSFVSEDRLPPAHYLEYGLLQFFTAKKREANTLKYWDLVRFKVFQRYDFREAVRRLTAAEEERRPFSNLFSEFELRTLSRLNFRYDLVYNFYGLGLSQQKLSLSINQMLLDHFSLGFQRDKLRKVKQLSLSGDKRLFQKFIFRGRLTRNLLRSETTYSELGVTYQGSCYSVSFSLGRTPEETRFSVWVNLLGLGGYGRSFSQTNP